MDTEFSVSADSSRVHNEHAVEIHEILNFRHFVRVVACMRRGDVFLTLHWESGAKSVCTSQERKTCLFYTDLYRLSRSGHKDD